MITPSDLLATGLVLPAVAEPAHDLPAGATCAITGAPISRGYLVADMVTVATTEFLDGFRGGVHGHVSESAARCFRSANPRAGNPCARSHLAFEDGTYYAPLIALEAATAQSRPCWSDLVRAVWPARQGQQVLCLLTTDTKKRLWHKARVGALGPRTPVYLYDNPTNEQQTAPLDWAKLLDCLDLVERAYDLGFAKPAIRESLLSSRLAVELGLKSTVRLDRELSVWRPTYEFRFAVLIAQRRQVAPPKERTPRARPPRPAAVPAQGSLF